MVRLIEYGNLIDLDSRILPTHKRFVHSGNYQIAVGATLSGIVTHLRVTCSAGPRTLAPRVEDVRIHLGLKPHDLLGDAGFANQVMAASKQQWVTAFLNPNRANHCQEGVAGLQKMTKMSLLSAMAARPKRETGCSSPYLCWKHEAAPMFAWNKWALADGQFLTSGLDQVRGQR